MDKLAETSHLSSSLLEHDNDADPNTPTSKSVFDFVINKSKSSVSSSKPRVKASNSTQNLNSIANLTACEPLTKEPTQRKNRYSSYGELNSLKSILKSNSRKNTTTNDSNSDVRCEKSSPSKTVPHYRSEYSTCSRMSRKIDSVSIHDNSNNTNKDLSEILTTNHHLYKFYITRLKHSLIISFLILMPIQNILLFIVSLLYEQDRTQLFFESITLCTVSLVALVLVVYLAYNEKRLKEYPILICTIIYALITLNQIIPVMRLKSRDFTTIEYGPFVIFNIVVVHSIFPLNKYLTVLYSSSISLFNFLLLSFLFYNSNLNVTVIIKKVNF